VFAFNNQIRFNKAGVFNLPVGKRDFNDRMKNKLRAFIDRLQAGDFIFSCTDFREIDLTKLTEQSLVYCDPPYLITCATYNEQGGWNEPCEHDLLALLDELDRRTIKFALSNVLRSKGKENRILTDWLSRRKYRVVRFNYSYANANYQTKDKTGNSEEVLIMNY